MKFYRLLVLLPFLLAASAVAQETPFSVQLTASLSSSGNHKGDPVTASVVSPASCKGDLMQGKVTQVGRAEVQFTFDTLLHGSQSIPISTNVTSIANSKGQQGVDEEGNSIQTGAAQPHKKHHSGWGHFGGSIGGMINSTAQQIGSDVDTAVGMLPTQVSSSGSSMTLGVGATIGLNVKATNGTDLAGLPSNQPAQASNSGAPAGTSSATGTSSASASQPNLVTTKQDFVPGEKTVFMDNFHDMPPGEPPPHWKVRNGTVSLAMGGGIRELRVNKDVNLTSATLSVPEDFTFQMKYTEGDTGTTDVGFRDKEDNDSLDLDIDSASTGSVSLTGPGGPNGGSLGSGELKKGECINPCEVDVWAQGGRVRLYFNGKRLADANEVHYNPVTHIVIHRSWSTVGLRSIRIAETAPDPARVLATTGKFVTHGIYFDTDSATLKPASAGVIKEISTALYKQPDMKLEIDGYTDSSGNAAHNQDLSQRRAAAVKSVLVSQFGIDASRLTAKGYGDANPIATNDTAAGRAENRRVEFIKEGANGGSSSGGGAGGEASASPSVPAAGAQAGASAERCAPPTVPTGTKLFPAYTSGSKNYVPLKPPERVAYLMLLSIRKLEQRCDNELNRYCTLPELVRGVQGSKESFNGPLIALSTNPACDPHYHYAVAKVMGGWRLTIEPRRAGLGGFLDDEGAPPGTGIYYNPSGAATRHSRKLNGNGWGVGPHAQGGDFEHHKG